ncbi:FAD-dependent monooxygenase [Nocardia neocaledoniensis]|uniref:FAD-dependent monooxygenase n=1 Tax=Nocardia neocaledoniensis TaxID=236511 RepID=UPI0024570CE8|nr:FAD-dependent monooxygenase [Nocardia neocaledoniensis]
MKTDVIVVGAGPAGLMLAGELSLAGVRPIVLERRAVPGTAHKASGLGGRILDMLRYRGLLDRFAAVGSPIAAPIFPFGGMHIDFTSLADGPMDAMGIPQARVEELLAERAGELGAEIRRGHEVVALDQDEEGVTVRVEGPEGAYTLTARYLVGCDGGRSRIRELAGIAFPGNTFPEVNRLGLVTVPDTVPVRDDGGLDLPGYGPISPGFTRTERGVFAIGPVDPAQRTMFFQTTEEDRTEYDNDDPLTLAELAASAHRVLGAELPLGDPIRLSRYQFQARRAERFRSGRVLLAGDAAHLLPATGTALNVGMLDAVNLGWKLAATVQGWAPAGLLDSYHEERHAAAGRALQQTRAQAALRRGQDEAADALRAVFQELFADEPALRRLAGMISANDVRYPVPGAAAHPLAGTFAPDLPLLTDQGETSVAELLHAGRPVLLDLADRADLRETARGREPRLVIVTAKTEDRPADAILLRPDAFVGWAAAVDESADTAATGLRDALDRWVGQP